MLPTPITLSHPHFMVLAGVLFLVSLAYLAEALSGSALSSGPALIRPVLSVILGLSVSPGKLVKIQIPVGLLEIPLTAAGWPRNPPGDTQVVSAGPHLEHALTGLLL